MRKLLWSTLITAFSLATLVGAVGATAQDAPPQPTGQQADAGAPPVSNALVARLSLIRGNVSTQRGDTGDWVVGAINTPLVSGDKIAVGAGRAEIQLDYANILRMSDNSQANLSSLNNGQIQLQVAQGLTDYVVLKGAQASAQIDTPNISVRPQGPGVYRIEVVSPTETRVMVRQGEAEISTPQGSTTLKKGQLITVQGTDTPQYQITDAPQRDSWDQWNKDRDATIREAKSVQYTNPYYTGVQDLDTYGTWSNVPDVGQVWSPYYSAGWSPYSNGQWCWEPGWGWTWVGYEPWGWAPYHYGRWFF
ncbi:MAG: DUF6600 domain-containing protein, partial [Acidimicrobiales bacterium]